MAQNFSGQNLRGKSFKGQDLTGADFSGADIRSVNFKGAKLTGANFGRARAGLVWTALLVRTVLSLLLGVVVGLLAAVASFWMSILTGVVLGDGLKITDSRIQAIGSIGLLIIFTVILVLFIRKGSFWSGFMTLAVSGVGVGAVIRVIIRTMVVAKVGNWTMAIGMGSAGAAAWILIMTAIVGGSVIMSWAGTTTWVVVVVVVVAEAVGKNWVKEAAGAAGIILMLGWYLRRQTLCEDPQLVWLRRISLWFNALGGANFQQADLTAANFADADLKHARFMNARMSRANWQGAKHLYWARLYGSILADQATRELLVTGNAQAAIARMWQPSPTAFVGKNLKGAYLVNADLHDIDFMEADFSGADLTGANLRDANLTKTVMLGANLRGADLTGATLDAWNIDSATQLDGAYAEYVYLKAKQQERRPQSGVFGAGEFSKLFQEVLDTIDFIFQNGIDWPAFRSAFDQLRAHVRVESDNVDIAVQRIENKGDGVFVVRVAAPAGVNKEKAHQAGVEFYQQQLALQETKYQTLLHAKDEQIVIYREWLKDKQRDNIRMDNILTYVTEQSVNRLPEQFEQYKENRMDEFSRIYNEKLKKLLKSYAIEAQTAYKFQIENQIQEAYQDCQKFGVELDAENVKYMQAFVSASGQTPGSAIPPGNKKLPHSLHNKIVEFLVSIPNLHDSRAQRAFINSAGLDRQLQDQINVAGPPAQFFHLLVPLLIAYGRLEDGRNALVAVLETAQNYVGTDRKAYCDGLIGELL